MQLANHCLELKREIQLLAISLYMTGTWHEEVLSDFIWHHWIVSWTAKTFLLLFQDWSLSV